MSSTSIPIQVKLKLWIEAGGRCEYPGCNILLYRDDVTLAKLNRSYMAHIVSDSPKGPRGDKVLSKKLAKEFSNLMLLCDTHHRLIDKEDVVGHSVKILQEYKAQHEKRIEHVTGIDCTRKTYIVTYAANIGLRKGKISHEQVRSALLSQSMYPATDASIDLDMTQNATTDDSAEFWKTECQNIDGFITSRLGGFGPDGKVMNHLSVFALAPIPLLMYLGKKLGDILTIEVYQRHRDMEDWVWQCHPESAPSYSVELIRETQKGAKDIILELSLSDVIDQDSIRAVMGDDISWYRISIDGPNRDFLKSKDQLGDFTDQYRRLLSRIRADAGASCRLHVFPAVPLAIAIQMGRTVLPKSDAEIVVYDYNKKANGWIRTTISL
jgi:hypothetical protein